MKLTATLVVGLVLFAAAIVILTQGRRGAGKRRKKPAARVRSDAPSAPQRGGVFEVGLRDPVPEEPSSVEGIPPALQDLRLRREEDLSDEERERVAALCRAMPAPHPIQARVAGGLDSPEELKDAVASDAGLTASVLRTVNSAAFALAAPITSVQHAITYLGVSAVKGVVVQAAVSERAPAGSPEQRAVLDRIWKAARVSSAVAQMIGQELGLPRPSVVATSALFANLGDVAIASQRDDIASVYCEGSTLLARIDAQQNASGANTFIVGSALARHWDLPASLAVAIEQAGLPLARPPARHPLEGDELRQNLILYTACRVGDAVAYRGLDNIEELALQDGPDLDLYFLGVYLQSSGLSRLPGLFGEPGFRRKANRLITTLAG